MLLLNRKCAKGVLFSNRKAEWYKDQVVCGENMGCREHDNMIEGASVSESEGGSEGEMRGAC